MVANARTLNLQDRCIPAGMQFNKILGYTGGILEE